MILPRAIHEMKKMTSFLKYGFRCCAWLVFLTSLGLLLASSAGYGRRAGGVPLRFEPNPLVIPGVMQGGREYDVVAAVVNESSQPAQIVGARDYCSGSCYTGRGLPTVIPAGGQGQVTVHVQAGGPRDVLGELAFYTERPSQPTLTLRISGTIRSEPPHENTTRTANH